MELEFVNIDGLRFTVVECLKDGWAVIRFNESGYTTTVQGYSILKPNIQITDRLSEKSDHRWEAKTWAGAIYKAFDLKTLAEDLGISIHTATGISTGRTNSRKVEYIKRIHTNK